MRSMQNKKFAIVKGVKFFLLEGFEPLSNNTGIASEDMTVVCSHLPESCLAITENFGAEQLATEGLHFVGNSNVSVGGLVCKAIRFTQPIENSSIPKWAIIYPIGGETKLFVISLLPGIDDVEQIKHVRNLFRNVVVGPMQVNDVPFSFFEFIPSLPYRIARRNENQVILTVDGEYPLEEPSAPMISLSEISMRLLPAQFQSYIGQRLESLKVVGEQITQLSEFVFEVKAIVSRGGCQQSLLARYYFVPRFVFNAESFARENLEFQYIAAIKATFDSILPNENL